MSADFDDNLIPDNRYSNWICKFCSTGFHNLSSLEVHLNHGRCEEKHNADKAYNDALHETFVRSEEIDTCD